MKSIRFAHVSDTHICKNYEGSQMKDVFARCESPAESLKRTLKRLHQLQLNFVLFTGDLIHEGEKKDYDYLMEIIKEYLPETRTVFALGNHDRKSPFYESMGLEPQDSYNHVKEVEGLRIVVLDTAVPGEEAGAISREQEEWLEEVLKKKKTEYGTMLAYHHPVSWSNPAFSMEVSEKFRSIIRNSDVRAIFCGHTHENSVEFLEGIPQITADSTAFGVEVHQDEFRMVEKTGYSICTMDKDTWQVHVEQGKEQDVIVSMDMKAIVEIHEKTGEK